MAGPWEKYQSASTSTQEDGPWNKYREVSVAPLKEEPSPIGPKVYDKPEGPEQAGMLDRIKERVTDPQRWKAILNNTGPYAKEVVGGAVPLVVPAASVPRVAALATKLAEGKGLGYALGRTALSSGQGAIMAGADRKEGESWQDTIDRAKGGAKLSTGIQAAAEAVPYVGKALGYGARKVASALSGVDESVIANYAKRTDEVNNLIKQSGGDITEAADQVRSELAAGVQKAKRALNNQISGALEKSAPEASIEINPIVDRLETVKAKLNPNFKGSAIKDIDEMIQAIQSEAQDGMVNAKSLYQIKQFLNEGSASAYNKGGQIFTRAGEAARAAKEAAAEAREMIKPVAGDISKADGQLSRLHALEKRLNRNMLTPGKPDASLLTAGSGANPRNAANLKALEDVSGVPAAQRATDLATAKAFANPSLLPADTTGKSAARLLLLGGLGSAVAGPIGATAAALASPMAVKLAVNTANVGKQMTSKLPNAAQFVRENPIASQAVAQLSAKRLRDANPEDSTVIPSNSPLLGTPENLKGYDKWVQVGLERVSIRDAATAEKILADKNAKQLLIEASDAKPGSMKLKRIKEQLQKGLNNDSISSSEAEVLRLQRKPARGR